MCFPSETPKGTMGVRVGVYEDGPQWFRSGPLGNYRTVTNVVRTHLQ